MIRFNVGETQVLPLLLPGLTLAVGLTSVSIAFYWIEVNSSIGAVTDALTSDQSSGLGVLVAALSAIGVLALYIVSMFSGALLAIGAGYIEYHWLDKRRAKRLGISYDEYWQQWRRYLRHLETQRSSYISDYVDLFLFALRSSLAFAAFFLAAFISFAFPWWAPFVFGLFPALVLGRVANRYHHELAKYRLESFAEQPDVAESDTDGRNSNVEN